MEVFMPGLICLQSSVEKGGVQFCLKKRGGVEFLENESIKKERKKEKVARRASSRLVSSAQIGFGFYQEKSIRIQNPSIIYLLFSLFLLLIWGKRSEAKRGRGEEKQIGEEE